MASSSGNSSESVTWLQDQSLHDVCNLLHGLLVPASDSSSSPGATIGLILIHASWNKRGSNYPLEEEILTKLVSEATDGLECVSFAACVQVDGTAESIDLCFGDDEDGHKLPPPPEELPVLAIVAQTGAMKHSVMRYVPKVKAWDVIRTLSNPLFDASKLSTAVHQTVQQLESQLNVDVADSGGALRIFVAGDRSSAGKSSVCLGILGCLLKAGYAASDVAYIKPATQSESTQLIEVFCKARGVTCVPVGPLVYYRGFTRAFLAGDTDSTEQLLEGCGHAVDRVARGKRVVLVDGVGFPAVGSICGTDNASVSRACGYPVTAANGSIERTPMGIVLVGGSGVGSAVDAFNLNATFFEKKKVPVLGAIFNKLSLEGFYSLENCKEQVTSYFDQNADQRAMGRRPFGFVPLFPGIAGSEGMDHVDEYARMFGRQVDVTAIVEAATRVKESSGLVSAATNSTQDRPPAKRLKVTQESLPMRTRHDIEAEAITAGAVPSA